MKRLLFGVNAVSSLLRSMSLLFFAHIIIIIIIFTPYSYVYSNSPNTIILNSMNLIHAHESKPRWFLCQFFQLLLFPDVSNSFCNTVVCLRRITNSISVLFHSFFATRRQTFLFLQFCRVLALISWVSKQKPLWCTHPKPFHFLSIIIVRWEKILALEKYQFIFMNKYLESVLRLFSSLPSLIIWTIQFLIFLFSSSVLPIILFNWFRIAHFFLAVWKDAYYCNKMRITHAIYIN